MTLSIRISCLDGGLGGFASAAPQQCVAGAVTHPTADWAAAQGLCLQGFHPVLHLGPAQDPAFVQSSRQPLSSGHLTASTAAPQTLRTRGLGALDMTHKHTTSRLLSQVPGAPLRLLSRGLPAAARDHSEELSSTHPAGSELRRAPAGTRLTCCGEGFGTHQRPTSEVVGVQARGGEQSLLRPTWVHGHHVGFTPESGLSSECSKDRR